jgi:antitoxin (DNA-binding transcriptional repressor) of toxin-antitoxin stability system
MLRNSVGGRIVAVDDVLGLFLYSDGELIRSTLDELVTAGVLESARGHAVAVTDKGREIVHLVFGMTQEFLDQLWTGHTELVARLLPLADRACAAVSATGGAAVRVVTPVYNPPDASPALKLAERLTPLRFHRFDAHAEAWRAEGLTVEEIQALDPGPLLDKIEAETNRWAAAPYCVLEPDERAELLHGLSALPA